MAIRLSMQRERGKFAIQLSAPAIVQERRSAKWTMVCAAPGRWP